MKEAINYKCSTCEDQCESQQLYKDHVAKCNKHCESDVSDLLEADSGKGSTQKLLNPLGLILNENDCQSFVDHFESPPKRSNPSMHVLPSISKISNGNEKLVNLLCDNSCAEENTKNYNLVEGETVSFVDSLDFDENETDTFTAEFTRTSFDGHENIEVIIEKDNSDITNSKRKSSIKILTVLSSNRFRQPVENNDNEKPTVDFSLEANSNKVPSDDGFVIKKVVETSEILKVGEQELSPTSKTMKTYKKIKTQKKSRNVKKNILRKPKKSKAAVIDLVQKADFRKSKSKKTPEIQTYLGKKPKQDNESSSGIKLYHKIVPKRKKVKKEPDQYSVFEFYDEEMEKRHKQALKLEKKIKYYKERTCLICEEVFEDPMDVLRHKREAHKTRKVLLPRKELEPYLNLEGSEKSLTHCPLCFKKINSQGYKSFYIKHIMIHCESAEFVCKVCERKFKRKDHLMNHESRHIVPPRNVS